MYTKAANNGHAGAQGRLGDAYENGDLDLLTDKKKALKWHRQAAEGGDGYAQYSLGWTPSSATWACCLKRLRR